MAFRARGRGQFTAPNSRSGKSYVYSGRRVLLKGDHFQINWNGEQVIANVQNSLLRALSTLSDEALSYMRSIVPVDTGMLLDSCYVNISVDNGKIMLQIGASAYYAVYVELGTARNSAKPFIRPTFDYIVRALPGLVRQEVSRRGR